MGRLITRRIFPLVAVSLIAILAFYATQLYGGPGSECEDTIYPEGLQGLVEYISSGVELECCSVLIEPVNLNASLHLSNGLLIFDGTPLDEDEFSRLLGGGEPNLDFIAGGAFYRTLSLPAFEESCPLRFPGEACIPVGSFVVPVNVSWSGLDNDVAVVAVVFIIASEAGNFSRNTVIPLVGEDGFRLVPIIMPDLVECGRNEVLAVPPWFYDANDDGLVNISVGVAVGFWGGLDTGTVNVTVGNIGVVLSAG